MKLYTLPQLRCSDSNQGCRLEYKIQIFLLLFYFVLWFCESFTVVLSCVGGRAHECRSIETDWEKSTLSALRLRHQPHRSHFVRRITFYRLKRSAFESDKKTMLKYWLNQTRIPCRNTCSESSIVTKDVTIDVCTNLPGQSSVVRAVSYTHLTLPTMAVV